MPQDAVDKLGSAQAQQQRPFGWLMDMIAHITGPQVQAPGGSPNAPAGQSGHPASGGPQPSPGSGKPSDAGSPQQPPGSGPLANVMSGQAGQMGQDPLGMMPQEQGSFGWLLHMLQQQQMGQQRAQGAGLVQLVGSLMSSNPGQLDLQGGTGQTPQQGGSEKPAPAKKG